MSLLETVFLVVIACVAIVVAFFLGMKQASQSVQCESDDDKVASIRKVTLYIDKAEAERLLAESEPVAPTKEELDELKAQLGIEKGSLQFKSGSVYHVVYDSAVRKHRRKRLGSYEELTSQMLSNG